MSAILLEETLSSLGFADHSFVLVESGGATIGGTDLEKLEELARKGSAKLPALLKAKHRIGGREDPIALFFEDGTLYFDGRSCMIEANA